MDVWNDNWDTWALAPAFAIVVGWLLTLVA